MKPRWSPLAAMALLALLVAADAPATTFQAAAAGTPSSPQVFADGTFVIVVPLHAGPGGRIAFRNATVYLDHRAGDAPQILLQGGTLEVTNSVVDTTRSGPYRIVGEAGRLLVVDSTFQRHGGIHMQFAGEPTVVRNASFLDARGPLSFTRGASGEGADSRFFGGTSGVSVHDASPALLRNHFRGIAAPASAIDVQSSVVGEKSYATMPRIEGNLVEQSWRGLLHMNGYRDSVVNNTFRGNRVGAAFAVSFGDEFAHRDAPIVTGNAFSDNNISLVVSLAGNTDRAPTVEFDARANLFLDTRCTHILWQPHPDGALVVDARDSWWGSAAGPVDVSETCRAVVGDVLVSPWRGAP